MSIEYYGYLYEVIIPTSEGDKHYYGKKEYDHRCKKVDGIYENYWGSGVFIKDWFLSHTNNVYTSRLCPKEIAISLGVKRIIHGYFETKEQLCIAEKELVSKHLGKAYCINMASGGTGGNVGHYVCTETTREKKRANHLGTKMWTNGVVNKKCKECPGEGWKLGLTLSEKELERRREYMKRCKRKPFTESQHNNTKLAIEANKIKVKCIELDKCFDSLKIVQEFFNASYNKVKVCCEDRNKTWKGFHWEYV